MASKSALDQYFELQLQKAKKDNDKTIDDLKVELDYDNMYEFEKAEFDRKYAQRDLKKQALRSLKQIEFEKNKKKRNKEFRQHHQLLPKVPTYKDRHFVRTSESRKKSFIPTWAQKFTKRPITKGDEIDALYVVIMSVNSDEMDFTCSDWYYLGKSVKSQLRLFGFDYTIDDNMLSVKDMGELMFNGTRPTRVSKAVKFAGLRVQTVDDYQEAYRGSALTIDGTKAKGEYLSKYIAQMKDIELQSIIDHNEYTHRTNVTKESLTESIRTSEAYKVYLLENTMQDRRQDWMRDIYDMEKWGKDSVEYDHFMTKVHYFLYIATMLHRSGYKLPTGVVNFVEKNNGQIANCIDEGDGAGYSVESRAIHILSNFNHIHEIILYGKLIDPVPLYSLTPCDKKYIDERFMGPPSLASTTKVKTQAKHTTKAKTEVNTASTPKVETETQPTTKAKPEVNTASTPKVETEAKPTTKAKPEVNTASATKVETEAKPTTKAKPEVNTASATKVKTEPSPSDKITETFRSVFDDDEQKTYGHILKRFLTALEGMKPEAQIVLTKSVQIMDKEEWKKEIEDDITPNHLREIYEDNTNEMRITLAAHERKINEETTSKVIEVHLTLEPVEQLKFTQEVEIWTEDKWNSIRNLSVNEITTDFRSRALVTEKFKSIFNDDDQVKYGNSLETYLTAVKEMTPEVQIVFTKYLQLMNRKEWIMDSKTNTTPKIVREYYETNINRLRIENAARKYKIDLGIEMKVINVYNALEPDEQSIFSNQVSYWNDRKWETIAYQDNETIMNTFRIYTGDSSEPCALLAENQCNGLVRNGKKVADKSILSDPLYRGYLCCAPKQNGSNRCGKHRDQKVDGKIFYVSNYNTEYHDESGKTLVYDKKQKSD